MTKCDVECTFKMQCGLDQELHTTAEWKVECSEWSSLCPAEHVRMDVIRGKGADLGEVRHIEDDIGLSRLFFVSDLP